MLTKRTSGILVALFVVISLGAAERVEACSGDDCGCGYAAEVCRSLCPPVGDPTRFDCLSACKTEEKNCAVCCCCAEGFCPPYCGGGLTAGLQTSSDRLGHLAQILGLTGSTGWAEQGHSPGAGCRQTLAKADVAGQAPATSSGGGPATGR